MWHRRRTLRVCPLRSTFFARIGHLGPWKASSHKRHQFPPQFSIFPPNLNSFGEAGEATNYLLFTAIPLYQWTLAWPHEKCLPPQSSSFSVHHSTVRTSAVRFLGPNERPDSSASISRFSFFPPVSQSWQEFSPSLSSAKKDFDESVIAQFYLIVSIALKHKPSFALSDLVRPELFCLSLRWETLDVTHLWSPSVTEPLPMLCFVSPPCEEVLLLHTCPLVFSLIPKGLTKTMLLIITMTNLSESTCVFARAMQRCSDQHCCLLVKGLIPTQTSRCGVCTFSLCIPVCFSRYPNHRSQSPDLHIGLIGPIEIVLFFFSLSLSQRVPAMNWWLVPGVTLPYTLQQLG